MMANLTIPTTDEAFIRRSHAVMHEFETRAGKRPQAWYLGHEEIKLLKGDMTRMFGSSWVTAIGPEREEYCGLPIFVVNAPSHLAVG